MDEDEIKDLVEKRTALEHMRNHLARERTRFSAERTISSWMRTGLASVGGGFAIIRLLVYYRESHRMIALGIGEALILWGMVIFVLSLIDYRECCKGLGHAGSLRNQWWVTITIFMFLLVAVFLSLVALT